MIDFPPPVHAGLCDRFSIATTRRHHLTAVTGDEQFARGGVPVVR